MVGRREIDVVFVTGPPGAGKTTVVEGYRAEHPYTDHFGTGELVSGIRDGDIESEYADILQEAARKGTLLPNASYSLIVRERIRYAAEHANMVMVTGFPHDYGDWRIFNRNIANEGIRPLGSVVLNVGLETSVARMQQRDADRGMDVATATSSKERLGYEERYHGLMGRHAIRLDCYRRAGLSTVPIYADRPPGEVLVDFTRVVDRLREGEN